MSTLPEQHRLVLQCLVDRGGESCAFPMWLRPSELPLELVDCLWSVTSGVASYRITEKGRQALRSANVALGADATRYVHHLITFRQLKPILYGWPFLVPLTQPVWKFEGAMVADDPTPDARARLAAPTVQRRCVGDPMPVVWGLFWVVLGAALMAFLVLAMWSDME